MERGLLIVFEGIDGCGKSTQLRALAERLRDRGTDVIETKEPTDGPMGRRIREMARSNEPLTPELELEWFMTDRREHVREVIEPGLATGATILCDRYFLSTVAYQGARGLDANEIMRVSEAEFPLPDLALIFELSAVLGIARVNARGGVGEPVFEELEFQKRVEKGFASLDRPYIERIDARPSATEIEVSVEGAVRRSGVSV